MRSMRAAHGRKGLNMLKIGIAAAALMAAQGAMAVTIAWTDWTAENPNSMVGTIAAPGGTVNVTYTGPYEAAPSQTACGTFGTFWWTPGTYNGSYNKPFDCDMVALAEGGTKTITFDKAVTDPYIALESWNGNTVDFGTKIEIVANGSGFWGSGTPVLNGSETGFFGNGEVHGIIRLPGTFTSITFIDTSENWHGFTIGIADVAGGVPEPATWAMMILGFGLVGATARRRRQGAVSA
jgi:hypothetical protein